MVEMVDFFFQLKSDLSKLFDVGVILTRKHWEWAVLLGE